MVIGALAAAMVTPEKQHRDQRNYEPETDPRRKRDCEKRTVEEEERRGEKIIGRCET